MIDRYSDRAANERTYLAWVRTGLALIAFGFAMEKFHLSMLLISDRGTDPNVYHTHAAGLSLVVVGLTSVMISLYSFVRTNRKLASPEPCKYSPWPSVTLGVTIFILILLIVVGFFY